MHYSESMLKLREGGDWLIVKMLWGWMDINCSSSNYKCFQMKLSEIRRSLPVFRGFFGTTHGKRQTHVTAHHTMFFFFSWMQGEFVYLRHHRHAFLQPSGRGKMSTLDVSAIKEKYTYKTGRNVECLHVLSAFCFFHKHTLPAVTPATELGLLTPPLIHRDGKKTGNRQPQWMELQNTYLYQPAAETPD